MRKVLVTGLAFGGLAAVVLPAAAQESAAVGWWWLGRPTASVPPIVPPATAPPAGGLYVAAGAAGPSAISALRYKLAPGVVATDVTLRVADVTGVVAIDVCAAEDPWEPAENGAWDQRPAADCESGSVKVVVDAEQSTISFDVSALSQDQVVDVVLVPAEQTEAGDTPIFEVTFDAPDAGALRTTAAEPSPDPQPAPPPAASGFGPAFPAPPASGSVFVPPVSEVATPGIGPPATSEPGTAAEVLRPSPLGSGPLVEGGFAYPAVLGLPLLLLVGAAYFGWVLTQPVTVTRRLAPGGA